MSDQSHLDEPDETGGELEPETTTVSDEEFEIPSDPAEAVPVLLQELLSARAESAELLDKWKRASADFENFRKRAQRDQAVVVERATERVLSELLPTLDSFDAAVAFEAETAREEQLLTGVQSTRNQLLATLASAGLEPIDALGTEFDPELHEAVQVGQGSGTMLVTAELRKGYRLNGQVLRAALVSVGYQGDEAHE